jgi:hypothetical protein
LREDVELALDSEVVREVKGDATSHSAIGDVEIAKAQQCVVRANFDLRRLRLRLRLRILRRNHQQQSRRGQNEEKHFSHNFCSCKGIGLFL